MTNEQPHTYAAAYAHYDTGQYELACALFTQLILGNPLAEPYWRGLAAGRQMQQNYLDALHAWSVAALLAEDDPLPHFHAAECLVSLGDTAEALTALDCAKKRSKKAGEISDLQAKIELLIKIHSKAP